MYLSYMDSLILMIAKILNWLILARVIISWISPNRFNPLIVQLYKITDPILKPFQDMVPPSKFGIDISPMIAIVVINMVARFLINFL